MTAVSNQTRRTMPATGDTLLDVQNLEKFFPIRGGLLSRVVGNVKAVNDVSFKVGRGEVVGLVGESGSGKTTAGRAILRLIEPTGGQVLFNGTDITKLSKGQMRDYRREMQIIFQDPFASLNPRMTVSDIIGEAMQIHNLHPGKQRVDRIAELLQKVGLRPEHMRRYPHEFSGGQRQRIGIARALAVDPAFIVADEPVSALDVSIQAQVVNLLEDLREKFGLTYLFIAHDLSVVRHLCQRVAVMYLGHIVEMADSDTLFDNPQHPYTRALLAAVPVPDPDVEQGREFRPVKGEVPSPMNPPSGCVFHPRCPMAVDRCSKEAPQPREIAPGHMVACSEVKITG